MGVGFEDVVEHAAGSVVEADSTDAVGGKDFAVAVVAAEEEEDAVIVAVDVEVAFVAELVSAAVGKCVAADVEADAVVAAAAAVAAAVEDQDFVGMTDSVLVLQLLADAYDLAVVVQPHCQRLVACHLVVDHEFLVGQLAFVVDCLETSCSYMFHRQEPADILEGIVLAVDPVD